MTTNTTETKFRTLAPMAQVMHGLFGQFTVALSEDSGTEPGRRYGMVVDTDGQVFGSADDFIYRGRGWSIHTEAFAGFVDADRVVLV